MRWNTTRKWIQPAVIGLGAIWAISAFVFNEPIELRSAEPHMEVRSCLEVVAHHEGSDSGYVVKGRVRLDNRSNFSVWIVGSLLDMRGHRITAVTAVHKSLDYINGERRRSKEALDTFPLKKTMGRGTSVSLGFFGEGFSISPREAFETEFLGFVPYVYDAASLDVSINYARRRAIYAELEEGMNEWQLVQYVRKSDERVDQIVHRRLLRRIRFSKTQSVAVAYLRDVDAAGCDFR